MIKNIVFLGLPGSGKGTQAQLLAKCGSFKLISTGFILRSSVFARDIINSGKLISDEEIIFIVEKELSKEVNFFDGVIFDGFPRTVRQASSIDSIKFNNKPIVVNFVVNIKISEKTAFSRLSSRIVCKSCDSIYNLNDSPPKIKGFCDNCDGIIDKRIDDANEKAVKERISIAMNNNSDILKYYEKLGFVNVIDIDGSLPKDKVFLNIKKHLSIN